VSPTRSGPAWLDPRLPCWRTPRTEAGLFAVVDATADISWTDKTLAGDDTELLVWTGAGAQPERGGLQAAQRHGVRAVALAPAGADLRRLRAATQVACRLRDTRGDTAASAWAHLTSADPPATVDQSVRIPHLLTLRYSSGHVADTVVWELIPRVAAPQWSRIAPATRAFIEAHLPQLLALRTAARTGNLPQNTAGQRLADTLAGKPLSTRIAYRHLDLIRGLLGDPPAGPPALAPRPADPVAGSDRGGRT
jgi:hypothetical protein